MKESLIPPRIPSYFKTLPSKSLFHATPAPRMKSAALALSLILTPLAAEAATPELNRVLPRGAQVGTELTLNLYGNRLHDAEELIFYEPGLEVLSLEPINKKKQWGKRVKVRVPGAPEVVLQ